MALYTHLEEFEVKVATLYQMQIVITAGTVSLEVSQDGLPFSVAETFTSDTVRLVRLVDAKYRFNIGNTAQCSIIPTRFQ